MDETTQVIPAPEQSNPGSPEPKESVPTTSSKEVYPGGQSGHVVTTTTIAVPTKQITETAEVIARVGPDPVMLGSMIVFGSLMLGLILTLINRFQKQQEKSAQQIYDSQEKERERWNEQVMAQRTQFTDALKENRDEFRDELHQQREAHVESLNKIVAGHKEGMEKVAVEISNLGSRVDHLENTLQSGRVTQSTQETTSQVRQVVIRRERK